MRSSWPIREPSRCLNNRIITNPSPHKTSSTCSRERIKQSHNKKQAVINPPISLTHSKERRKKNLKVIPLLLTQRRKISLRRRRRKAACCVAQPLRSTPSKK
jgi:hypothetical protein